MGLLSERPLGFEIIAVWTGLLGLASLVLSVPRSLTYLPVGVLYVAGSYGLWRQTRRGAAVLVAAWVVGAAHSAFVVGQGLPLLGAVLVAGYVYHRRAALKP
ncbi:MULTISPECIES: hypothetical protein [Halobacterium]|uniref:hypothetical protein n=1 Tax=Halobacterium TaxID=2239 RepID=UPI00073E6878|nr:MULTISPECIES: hypothetical protein [Halobacterium]MCG1004441.1 hypothetical protein [Halobacterium noricense]